MKCPMIVDTMQLRGGQDAQYCLAPLKLISLINSLVFQLRIQCATAAVQNLLICLLLVLK